MAVPLWTPIGALLAARDYARRQQTADDLRELAARVATSSNPRRADYLEYWANRIELS